MEEIHYLACVIMPVIIVSIRDKQVDHRLIKSVAASVLTGIKRQLRNSVECIHQNKNKSHKFRSIRISVFLKILFSGKFFFEFDLFDFMDVFYQMPHLF